MSSSVLDQLLASLDGDQTSTNSGAIVLSHQNLRVDLIVDVQIVYVEERNSNQDRVSELVANGYQVLAILVIRHDSMGFGAPCVSSVKHQFATVMVKLKEESK